MFGEPAPAPSEPLKVESSQLNVLPVADPVGGLSVADPLPSTTPNDPALPPPPKKRGRPKKIVDVKPGETEEQAIARESQAADEPYPFAACGFCGDTKPKADHAETCPARTVNPLADQTPLAPWDDAAKAKYHGKKAVGATTDVIPSVQDAPAPKLEVFNPIQEVEATAKIRTENRMRAQAALLEIAESIKNDPQVRVNAAAALLSCG